jgi:hydroxymethylglutaryl-CoA reductase
MFIDNFRTVNWDSIAALPHNTPPLWGSMTLQHMIEHLADVFRASNGTIKVEVVTTPEKLEKVLRVVLFSDRELQRNVKAPVLPAEPIPYRTANMQAAIDALKLEMEKFENHYATDKNRTENHPVFGPLTYAQWEVFQKKHFTHHFKQFGLIEDK